MGKASDDRFEQAEILAIAASAGDNDAFGDLYELYANAIYRFVVLRVRNKHQAEDVTSKVWLKAYNKINDFSPRPGTGGFTGWLFAIARTILLDTLRSEARRPATPTADMFALDSAAVDATPEEVALRHETSERLAEALAKDLTASQAECVTLRFYQGMTIAETAAIMGTTTGAVKVLQHRALKSLRRKLPDDMRTFGETASVMTTARVVDVSHSQVAR